MQNWRRYLEDLFIGALLILAIFNRYDITLLSTHIHELKFAIGQGLKLEK